MIGNKADLDSQREVTFEEAKQFAEENGNVLTFIINNCCQILTEFLGGVLCFC